MKQDLPDGAHSEQRLPDGAQNENNPKSSSTKQVLSDAGRLAAGANHVYIQGECERLTGTAPV